MKLPIFASGIALLLATPHGASSPEPAGILPAGENGQPLNTDFETGNLLDWKAEGPAFQQQPIKGDTVAKRRKDNRSAHDGDFWIGGWERGGDEPTGTLTSAPFVVNQPWAAFRVAGGGYEATRVELVKADSGEVIFRTAGFEPDLFAKQNNASETLRPVVVDLKPFQGQKIFIRLVDQATGHWGHLNFDNFRLYANRPALPDEMKPAPKGLVALPGPGGLAFDEVKFAGLPGEQAAKEMTVPEGFTVKLAAAEPEIQQPVAMALDDRGRLWVAEGLTYPNRAPEGKGKDRILVFEDKDGDGKFDKRTVFIEGLNLVSGIEVGFGGLWVGAAPYLAFIPMIDGDEPKPAGEMKVLLDGWGFQDTHETLNTFIWGPDGWLYGCHGVFTHSKVGKPGTPDDQRTKINAGIWRYHPTKHVFEVFAEGTSNPWGVDFNDHGQAFATACVIPHLFHIIQGARYNRQAGQHFNPYIFEDIKTCADHLHYATANPHAGNRRSSASGGGHAHCGAMIYLGGTWPAQYRNQIFMNNIHGARLNVDLLERKGSGYVGKHGPDFLLANDEWSQIINLRYGPDGSAYMIDWYDKQACHSTNAALHDRSNGRIFKIAHQNDKKVTGINLARMRSRDLIALQMSENDWYVRHARRILQERFMSAEEHQALRDFVDGKGIPAAPQGTNADEWTTTRRLRALWALHVTGGLNEAKLLELIGDKDEWMRAWAVQLLCENQKVSDAAVQKLAAAAVNETSPTTRLYLAAAAQRIEPARRWDLVSALASRKEDAADKNVPLLVWYAAEPLSAQNPAKALEIALKSEFPQMANFTARRVAAIGTPDALNALTAAIASAPDENRQLALLQGWRTFLDKAPDTKAPQGWDALAARLQERPALRDATLAISVRLGSASAMPVLRAQLRDAKGPVDSRRLALESLLRAKDPEVLAMLKTLLNDPALRADAIRALAQFEDGETPRTLLKMYPELSDAEKMDAVRTLVSRAGFARELVGAIEAGQLNKQLLTAEIVRQIRQFKDEALNAKLDKMWGAVRETPEQKKKEIERFKGVYAAGGSTPGDPRSGRAVYNRVCAQCHTLFESGAKIGPDLTGSNRANLDYILENIVDPNAVIPNEYQATILETKGGQMAMGPVKQQDAQSVTLATLTGPMTVARSDIKSLEQSPVSMMPEGLLNGLTEQEVRDLIYYLRSPAQVPLPNEPAQAAAK